MDELQAALKAFDGKDTAPLEAAANDCSASDDSVSNLVEGLQPSGLESQAASWILKRWWEQGWQLSSQHAKQLIDVLMTAKDWPLRLHILQLLPGLVIAKSQHKALYYHLRHGLEDKNKFVRAWTYNGLAEVAKQYSEYRDEVSQLFELALKDEAASVKARIRNITL